MKKERFQDFCVGEFWNDTRLLNNTWPEFTDCFVYTVPNWVPSAFLLLMLPHYLFSIKENVLQGPFRVQRMNICRLVCCLCLCKLSMLTLVLRIVNNSDWPAAAFLGDSLHIATYLALAVMTQYERMKRAQSTSVHFFFWMVSLLCSTVPLYTSIMQKEYSKHGVLFAILITRYALQVVTFISTFFSDVNVNGTSEYTNLDKEPCPESTCSFPSYLTFSWMTRLLLIGRKRDLEEKDIWDLPETEKSNTLMTLFQNAWDKEKRKSCTVVSNMGTNPADIEISPMIYEDWKTPAEETQTKTSSLFQNCSSLQDNEWRLLPKQEKERKESKPSLARVLCKIFIKDFCISVLQKIASDIITLLNPLLLGALMGTLKEGVEGHEWHGYILSLGMLLTTLLSGLLTDRCLFLSIRLGIRIKAALATAIYKKVLVVCVTSENSASAGEIFNLMSIDTQRIFELTQYLFFCFTAPVQIIAGFALLYYTLGASGFAGLICLAIMVPLNACAVSRQTALYCSNLQVKDARVKMYNEVLSGIKVVKLYAWEPSFLEKIQEFRMKEIATLFKIALMNALLAIPWDMMPFLLSLVSFGTYILTDGSSYLDTNKAFVSIAIFNIMQYPISIFPSILAYSAQAHVSVRRINEFLNSQELDPAELSHHHPPGKAISIRNATWAWETAKPALIDINLDIDVGRLVAVVGPEGSGKSSLISAVLGEMHRVCGSSSKTGRIAYVPQEAWIQNATLRDNILFGKPYIRSEYELTLKLCELRPDINILPAGDMTEIGENGINLSGGQKQRVSLARAVYSNADIYLLDDPLSAVDSHVGKAIFNNVIGSAGILKGKTRILITHGIHWLPMVDEIIVMNDGEISERGSYDELLFHNGPFSLLLKTFLNAVPDSDEEDDNEIASIRRQMKDIVESETSDATSSRDDVMYKSCQKKLRRERRKESPHVSRRKIPSGYPGNESGKLTTIETIEKGNVNLKVFSAYIKAAGVLPLLVAFLCHCTFQTLTVMANVWVEVWTSDLDLLNASKSNREALTNGNTFYFEIYCAWGLGRVIFLIIFNYLFWVRMTIASREMHARMASRLLRAPMSFFDTTPIGRILNRVSRDVDTLDTKLPTILTALLIHLAALAVTLMIIIIKIPLTSIFILPAAGLFLIIQRFYASSGRQLQRLESVTRSPVYNLFSETLSGATSIRAYGVTQRFTRECRARVDSNNIYLFAYHAATRWLSWNMTFLSGLIILVATMFAVLDRSSVGDVGFSISYALKITITISWLLRQVSDFETNIVSVQRIKEYSELPTEADWDLPQTQPPDSWPDKGEINFTNFQTSYREGLEPVLKGISCTIKESEKVGIVGRTGAGKTSLTLSLFRLIESTGGAITIDGVNIATLGLHTLRFRLTVLPQEAKIFTGTLRWNLDPFHVYTDVQLWAALDQAHMKDTVSQLTGGLDFEVEENGCNLSFGQRQLLCLARTLLRKTKILVLDEATASIDMETDALIQQVIRSAFSSCTVITIAHRLNTIMECDRIIVMEEGQIKEFASPEELLQDKSSSFFLMAQESKVV